MHAHIKFIRKSFKTIIAFIPAFFFMFPGCAQEKTGYHTFADYPGFSKYYGNNCKKGEPLPVVSEKGKELLQRYRPGLILAPGGRYPIDFYRDYLPFTVMRRYPEKAIIKDKVTPEILKAMQHDRNVYLDFQFEHYRRAGLDRRPGLKALSSNDDRKPVVYGRVYKEMVGFPDVTGEIHTFNLTFLKYNIVFAVSGLPERLPPGLQTLLTLAGLNADDWHELDNFVAIHVVLDEKEKPIAIILAQHNHHRTYLIGKDIFFSSEGRIFFDIALRSNEVYPASNEKVPQRHRVVRWSLYMEYLLSGKNAPFFKGDDITYGVNAGGKEIFYDMAFLSPCDPFYTSSIILGEPKPFMGRYIGRDGPPGSDYYAVPLLLPLGNLLKFSYLHDGDPDDIQKVAQLINVKKKSIDIKALMAYGGRRFYQDLIKN